MSRNRIVSGVFLVAGLALAFLGQFYFTYRREFWRDGILFWCASLILFWILWRRLRQRGPARRGSGNRQRLSRWLSWAVKNPWRVLASLGGSGLSLVVGWWARGISPRAGFAGAFWAWVIGVAWFLMAFVPSVSVKQTLLNLGWRLRRRRLELAGLAALLLAALLVRAVDLEHIPANLGGDEGTQGLAALELVGPPMGNPFSTGWYSVPTMSFLAYGSAMKVFGATIAGARTLSALVGTLTVLTTFLFARQLWGWRAAWIAATLLAFGHYHIHFSRLASNQIGDGFVVTLALWLFVRGMQSRRSLHFAMAGTVVGLGWYGYFGARLVGVILAAYVAWLFASKYRFHLQAMSRRYGRLLLIFLLAALVAAAPLLLYYIAHQDTMAARASQITILSPGWLAREQEYSGLSGTRILLRQFLKSVTAFHYTLDPTFWYRPSIPLLDFLSGVLFLFGMVWSLARRREPGFALVLIWFWLALITGWVLTENPPSSQRMVIIAPALALLVGLGMRWLMSMGERVFGKGQLLHWRDIAILGLVLISILNLYYYFVVYTPTRIYGNPTAEIATNLGRYLGQQDDDYVVYFYGPTVMYFDIGNLSFLARDVVGVNVYPPDEDRPPVDLVSGGARFVFLPQRLGELETVREQFPGGERMDVHSMADGRLLYVVYEVGPR
ncbi:MAG: glycosyltransferase family 39 protein [Anaerolineae bacterium]|nr:glycosyltransferase family 39 protein [Anaerolineae bacterium]